jgi:crotonobetainyl-CoA:carnitine CoA-transferase CaiB-like acyl-CoA transferase
MSALDGLRVLELSGGIACGYAGKLLRDQGAEVVKFEPPDGDPLRWWSAASPDAPIDRTGALFAHLHAGKASVTPPLQGDRNIRWWSEHWADVVLTERPPAPFPALAPLGMPRASATPRRSLEATLVTIEPFGADGVLADAPASEFTLQAWCGLMSGCGTPATPPLQMGILHGQWATGAVAAMAALAGVRQQRVTGAGPAIEISALEVMAVVLNNYPPLYRQFTGSVSFMSRSGDWPQVVPCKDGWIGLCVFTPQQWSDFAAMIGREDLSADDRLNSMGGRGRNRELAESVVRPWLATHTVAEICELGELFRVPVAQVGNGRDVLTMDHFVDRGVFVEHPEGFVAPRPPFLMSVSPVRPVAAAPEIGADTDEGRDAAHVSLSMRRMAAEMAGEPKPRRRMGPLPLAGVTVVDLTAFWAGPACTHQLATLGADVIKVESPSRPDGMRFATVRPPTEPDWMEYGPTFHGTNPGKRSVTIDFSKPEGRELVLRLVARADVVVENFTPRVLGNVALEYGDLIARRSDVILLRMPAFGLDGPWRDRPGFAQTTEQVSGIAWMTGEADGEALVRSTIDPIAGIHGAFVVLAALDHRERTGEGQQIEMPMAEVAMNVAAEPIVTWSAYGTLLERDGNRGAPGAPQGVYACAGDEQWVALSITDDREWRALVKVLGDPQWARESTLETGAGRRARHDEIDAHLGEWCADRDRNDTVARLLAKGVRAAPVWDQMIQDEMPTLAERGFTQWLEHPVAGRVGYPGTGVRANTFDNSYRAPAPTVGQHTTEVLLELGLTDSEIDELHGSGVI